MCLIPSQLIPRNETSSLVLVPYWSDLPFWLPAVSTSDRTLFLLLALSYERGEEGEVRGGEEKGGDVGGGSRGVSSLARETRA